MLSGSQEGRSVEDEISETESLSLSEFIAKILKSTLFAYQLETSSHLTMKNWLIYFLYQKSQDLHFDAFFTEMKGCMLIMPDIIQEVVREKLKTDALFRQAFREKRDYLPLSLGSIDMDDFPCEPQIVKKNQPIPSLDEEATLREYGIFLSNSSKVFFQLDKLENELRCLAEKSNSFFEGYHLKNYRDNHPYKHFKLLSDYLYAWAKENGFNHFVIDSFLNKKDFSQVLANLGLFKDKALGGLSHGEWTHFLQWYCIVQQHKETPFSHLTPLQIFKWLGELENNKKWSNTFEIPEGVGLRRDFRNVFNFNAYLLSERCASRFPVLHQLIKGRAMKREEKALSNRLGLDMRK